MLPGCLDLRHSRAPGSESGFLVSRFNFFIAFAAATIYCYASRMLPFLKEHFVVCGMFYGIAVFLTMYLVVMPLCAFHYAGPYTQRGLIQGIVVHMLLVGLPIGFSLNRWGE